MYQPAKSGLKSSQQVTHLGFTLIELLITVAIIGILAGVAYPSYVDYVQRSNRSEGQRELMRLANVEEQRFIDFRSYSSDMTDLGVAVNPSGAFETEYENYSITATIANNGTTFVLTATAINAQTGDAGCTPLTINEVGQKTPLACW